MNWPHQSLDLGAYLGPSETPMLMDHRLPQTQWQQYIGSRQVYLDCFLPSADAATAATAPASLVEIEV